MPTPSASPAELATPVPSPPSSSVPKVAPPSEPPMLVPEAEKGEQGARNLLLAWARALEEHRWILAYKLSGGSGLAAGTNLAQFAAAWGKYKVIDVTIGGGNVEGGAGSLYYEVPVTVTGLTQVGKPYHLSGTVTVRRVNDVDGATPTQLRWHFAGTTLEP